MFTSTVKPATRNDDRLQRLPFGRWPMPRPVHHVQQCATLCHWQRNLQTKSCHWQRPNGTRVNKSCAFITIAYGIATVRMHFHVALPEVAETCQEVQDLPRSAKAAKTCRLVRNRPAITADRPSSPVAKIEHRFNQYSRKRVGSFPKPVFCRVRLSPRNRTQPRSSFLTKRSSSGQ
jgi:hypothetical protein